MKSILQKQREPIPNNDNGSVKVQMPPGGVSILWLEFDMENIDVAVFLHLGL